MKKLIEIESGKTIVFSEPLFLEKAYNNIIMYVKKFIVTNYEFTKFKIQIEYILHSINNQNDVEISYPLFIFNYGNGKIINEMISCNSIYSKLIIENNHFHIWLPNCTKQYRNLTINEMDSLNCNRDIKKANIYSGEYFMGLNNAIKHSTFMDKNYFFECIFDFYESKVSKDNNIYIPFGILFPFKEVVIEKYDFIANNKEYIINKNNINCYLPFNNDYIDAFQQPLITEYTLYKVFMDKSKYYSTSQQLPARFNLIPSSILFFDNREIMKNDIFLSVSVNDLPIFTSIYPTMINEYMKELSPIHLYMYNNLENNIHINVEIEIFSISHKYSKTMILLAKESISEYIIPQLKDSVYKDITYMCTRDCKILIKNDNIILYENIFKIDVYPKEYFCFNYQKYTKEYAIHFENYLARFVTPTMKYMKEILSSTSHLYNIEFGCENNEDDFYKEVKAIYDFLSQKNIYLNTSNCFTYNTGSIGQNISLPENTYLYHSGNCIELTLLLASCYEAIGLESHIILVSGHAFLLVELITEKIYIESTLLGSCSFENAIKEGFNEYKEYSYKNKIEQIISVSKARKNKIFPFEI